VKVIDQHYFAVYIALCIEYPTAISVRLAACFDRNDCLYRRFQLPNESVPTPWQRLNIARALRRIPQHLANPINGSVSSS
jgi:hypothetical protein